MSARPRGRIACTCMCISFPATPAMSPTRAAACAASCESSFMLHVTNGDHAVGVIRAAGASGDILPWRDVLHEGPVVSALPLESLSRERAAFIAAAGWAPLAEVEKQFAERDARLLRCA